MSFRRIGFALVGASALACIVGGCGGSSAGGTGAITAQDPPPSGTNPPPAPKPNPPPDPVPDPIPPLLWPTPKPLDQAFGVTVNYSVKSAQEWDLLAGAGINLVRFDLLWSTVERQKGVYDFSNGSQDYDALVDALSARHIRIMFILDYGNPLYDDGKAPTTDAGRAAFAAFAGAAARHFAGKDVVWEIWNEPNIVQFWNQGPESLNTPSTNYAALALKSIIALRSNDPSAFIAVGAVSSLSPPGIQFIDDLGKAGVLRYVDAVSVHPYRNEAPETAEADYDSLRATLARSNAYGLPILDSECGRSSGVASNGIQIGEDGQAALLVRTRLADLISNVGLTTWYTWTNSSTDTSDFNGNFGITRLGGMTPKPAYLAASAMMNVLAGTRFTEPLNLSLGASVHVARFVGAGKVVIALWTSDGSVTQGLIPLETGQWSRVNLFGDMTPLAPNSASAVVSIGPSPTYLCAVKN